MDDAELFLLKALESLAGAESELGALRFNNCANRTYYACFQAAIAALISAGMQPAGGQWGHGFVRVQFIGQLINRRKRYSPELRDVLERTYLLRQTADYQTTSTGGEQVLRTLRRARALVAAIEREVSAQ
jgi:uncharacterized protein (UPF0332 family)